MNPSYQVVFFDAQGREVQRWHPVALKKDAEESLKTANVPGAVLAEIKPVYSLPERA